MYSAFDTHRNRKKVYSIQSYSKSLNERNHLEDLDINGRITLKLILSKMGCLGLYSLPSQYGPVLGFFEHGNEISGPLNAGNLLNS